MTVEKLPMVLMDEPVLRFEMQQLLFQHPIFYSHWFIFLLF